MEPYIWTPNGVRTSGRVPMNNTIQVFPPALLPALIRIDLLCLTLNMGIPDLIAVANACIGEPGGSFAGAGTNVLTLSGSPPEVLDTAVYALTPQVQYAYTQTPCYIYTDGDPESNPGDIYLDFNGVDLLGGSYACLTVFSSYALGYPT